MKLPTLYKDLTSWERREVRNEYVRLQNNNCFFCKQSLSTEPPKKVLNKEINWKLFPKNFLKYPVHLQHCHKTGWTEGAVHAYCNAVMWQYYGR